MEKRRISALKGLRRAGGGQNAALMLFDTPQGELGLEVLPENLALMLNALLQVAQIFGEHQPPRPNLGARSPAGTVVIPAEELAVDPIARGGAWVRMQVGPVDVSIGLPSKEHVDGLVLALTGDGTE